MEVHRVETLRLSYFLDNWLTDGGEVVSLTCYPPLTSQEDSRYSLLLKVEFTPGAIGQLKIPMTSSRIKTELLACSIVAQPTTQSHGNVVFINEYSYIEMLLSGFKFDYVKRNNITCIFQRRKE
jgi:hypothetical protein